MATLSTPTYGFPYPDGTERVMDGDNAMGALGVSVENMLKAFPQGTNVVQPSSAFTLPTGTPTQIPSPFVINLNPPQAELGIIFLSLDVSVGVTDVGVMTLQLQVDSVVVRTIAHTAPAGLAFRSTQTILHVVSYAAGSHNINVWAGKAGAGGTAQVNTPSYMALLRFRR